jgi:hypothetical protein
MVAARRIIALSIEAEQREALVEISRSRTEPANRVERARIVLAYLDKGAGHMIHHSAPEKVVDGINLAASRPGIAENSQSMQQPITVDAGHCNRLRNHEVKDASV